MIGTKLAHYEITSHLGSGGMGDVYQATDSKLGRSVAIKFLPEAFSHDNDRVARFEREARVLASLNHSNIAAIFGLEESGERKFLVMELVEGETLAERIKRGPIPVDEALTIAKQIAEALEAAHEKGIIHRDLKPANVKITPDGKVKVLDFGLAKAFDQEPVNSKLSHSPTLSMAATNAGVILGTAAYMSPEQAKGRALDKRTDIFAFGCVLYEMLTGKPGFEGEDVQDVLGAVLKTEPEWTRLPAAVPPSVRNLLRLCLEKNPRNRRSDAADVRIDIEQALREPEKTSPSMAPARSALVAWIAAAAMTIAFVSIAFVHFRTISPEVPEHASRLSILPPEKTTFIGGYAAPHLALSPDGTRLAFVPTPIGGRALLWVRHLDALEAQPLTGTDGATFPFWSPDSRMLAFFADGKLKAIDPNRGAPYIICDAPDARGGAWGRDGLIVFAPQLLGPLYRVAASGGGQPAVMTTLDASRQEVSHRLPSFLPDGRHFLFLVQSGKPENNIVHIGSVDSNEIQSLDLRASRAAYVAPGYLLFVRERSLTAQPFDLSRLRLSGEPVSLGQQVAVRTAVYGDGLFSSADNGTLVSWSGADGITDLTWFSRKGESLGTLGGPGEHLSLDLSPDEKRVAVELVDPGPETGDIWTIDLASGLRSRLISDPGWDFSPWWSPDGTRILFGSLRDGYDLYQTLTAGSGTDESVLKSADALGPTGWSSDNRFIVFQNMSKYKVGMLPLTGERTPKLALNSRFVESGGSLSPDGRWLAYTSNESGNWDIYVQPFPALDRKWRISPDGGSSPRWRRDGKELFYVGADQKLMAVSVTAESSFTASTPTALFQLRMIPLPPSQPRMQYAVTAKGDRFLVNTVVEPPIPTPVTVVLNWDTVLTKMTH